MKPKIIFIHGMFFNPKVWENWVTYFGNLGYHCEAPAWPYHGGDPAALRMAVPWELGTLGWSTVCSFHQNLLLRKNEYPIIIGHSVGGLLVQKLVASGLAQAGICIASAAPNKMLSFDLGFLRNNASFTAPGSGDEPIGITEDFFQRNFANTMTPEDSRLAFQNYAVPESRQILHDILGAEGNVDVDCPHVPLLFVGAGKDEIIPPSLVERNAYAYSDQRSYREFIEFPDRDHFICGGDGWKEVARWIATWIDARLAVSSA